MMATVDRLRRVGILVCAALAVLTCALIAVPAAQAAKTVTLTSAADPVQGFDGVGPKTTTATTTVTADPNALTSPPTMDVAPPGHRLTGNQVQAIADRLTRIKEVRKDYKGSYPNVYLKGTDRWQVSYFSRDKPPKEIAQVLISDATGKVMEQWTGPQVAWTMARGYPGAFGRKLNDPIVWIPLMILFLVPFVDRRRLLRMRHLDLLVLSGFSLSLMFFNRGEISTSVPMIYPLLAYLLARMLWIGLKRKETRADREPLRLLVPVSWLAIAVVFLLGFRIGLNVVDSNVIDVGYSGVIGADRIVAGDPMYGGWPKDNEHGDTYGPVAYAAYVPFEQIWPWNGSWDDLAAAHGAAILFDLLCVVLLFWLGRRLRGPTLGVGLAYAWVAFPFTLYALGTNSNDAFVPAMVLATFLVASSTPARGVFAALAGMVKFASLGLAPLFATYDPSGRTSWKKVGIFAFFFALGTALCLWPVLAHDTLREMYDRTIAYQADRAAPFSIWGLHDLPGLERVVQIAAAILAVALAFVPRRRDLVGLAALCAAVIIALQLGISYWFYLYIPWFFPLVMIAILGRHRDPAQAAIEDAAAIDDPSDAAPAPVPAEPAGAPVTGDLPAGPAPSVLPAS